MTGSLSNEWAERRSAILDRMKAEAESIEEERDAARSELAAVRAEKKRIIGENERLRAQADCARKAVSDILRELGKKAPMRDRIKASIAIGVAAMRFGNSR